MPYISKVTGVPMVDLATRVMVGKSLKSLGYGTGLYRQPPYVAVKVPVFSFEKITDANAALSPEMKSTGEVLGLGKNLQEAMFKGLVSAGYKVEKAERGGVPEVDFVAGVPDSGVPHAMGYANHSGKPLARPFVKYTPTWPRSFMPEDQQVRSRVARMKQIPVPELIEGKKLLFVDDSIVRGTQLRETVDFLYSTGAAEVHMRSACPPIMYPCRYLNFSRGNSAMDLLARRMVQELEGNEGQKHLEEYADSRTERGKCLLHEICAQFGFDSLSYQSLDGLLEAIGLDRDKVCTYCWTGKE